MKIFTIFGHAGFIGSFLKKKLKNNNNKLILPKKNQYVLKKKLGHIIYCIGSDNWKQDSYNSFYANLGHIIEIVNKNKFKTFTLLSTTRVYRKSKNTSEENNIIVNTNDCDDYYNLKKLCAESFLNIQNKKIKIIRLSNIYGNNFNSPLVIPKMINDSIIKKKIIITVNKNCSKDFLNINTASDIILNIILKGKNKIYNVASGSNVSLNKISKKIQKITKCKILLTNQNKFIIEPKININLIKKEFKFLCNSNILDDIENLINSFKKNINENKL